MAKMSKEEIEKKLNTLCKEYNEEEDVNKMYEISDEMKDLIGEYTALKRDECFTALSKTADPMVEAVKQLTYPCLRIQDKKEDDSDIIIRSIVPAERKIDLLKLHKFVKDGIGREKNWHNQLEHFNMLMTAKYAEDLGIDPVKVRNCYAMQSISREIDLGKTPCSNTNLLKTLQKLVTAMIGEEYKATSHDVKFLKFIYANKGKKALSVMCADHRKLREYMAEICNHIITNEPYEVVSKEIKEK